MISFTAACREAGVPSPTTERSAAGAALAVHPQSGLVWQVQRWVPGRVPERDDVPTAVWLAQQMATIHRLAQPCGKEAVDEWYTEVRHNWQQLAADASRAGVPWAAGLAERAADFEALAALVNSAGIGEPVYCHRDLQANNTLLDDVGRRWLLDWDNCSPQETWREFGTVLLHHVADDAAVARIAGAYREEGGDDWPETPQLFATGLAVWLNFLHGQLSSRSMRPPILRTAPSPPTRYPRWFPGVPSMQARDCAATATRGLPG